MNIVILSGRLTNDPEVRTVSGDKTVCNFTLAVEKRVRGSESTANFINCVAFGKSGENIGKFCKKGTKLNVQGEWTTGNYTNKDGQKVYTNNCTVATFEFGESKNAASSDSAPASTPVSSPLPSSDGFVNIPDGIPEELPFA